MSELELGEKGVESVSEADVERALEQLTVTQTDGSQKVDVWTGVLSVIKSVQRSSLGSGKTYLSAGVFTDDQLLLLTDHNNRRLVLVDETYTFVEEFKLDGKPTDITRGNEPGQFFVALRDDGILRCTFNNGQITMLSRMTSPTGAWGIAFLDSTRVVGTEKCICVLGADGQDIRSMSKSGSDTYVALSKKENSLYHKDGNTIIGRHMNGVETFRYADSTLVYPIGLDLDQDGNVYVCGRNSKNIHLVSKDGFRDRVLLAKLVSITNPYAIVVNSTRQEIVVTSSQEDTAFEVYRFCDNK
ncbi:uncharacterized protein LOC132548435 [Ylistrum balloti]|uniref:uncharacterized protein LOC132548435 n=1 Tax=Ylistrum balloti TaxID=509963 RepID=UPI002905DDE8|nr:uncharacterized protein LOC132548435 [Ylistrum balloti]